MMNKGDKYIHFTRFGGINIGEVDEYYEVQNIDTENQLCYYIPHIRSTNGIILELDGKDGRVYRLNDKTDSEYWLNIFNKIKEAGGIRKGVELEEMLRSGNRTVIK